jgi:hypothetical protein
MKPMLSSAASTKLKVARTRGIPVASQEEKKVGASMENSFEDSSESFRDRVDHQVKHAKDRIAAMIDSVKESWSDERRQQLSEAAERTRRQAAEYFRTTRARHILGDATDVIRRYPIAALVAGTILGLLWSRRKGD